MSDDQFTQFPEDADPVGLTGGPDGVTQYDVNADGIADIAVTVHGDVMVVETNIDGTTEAVVYDQDVPVAYANDADGDGQLGPGEIVEIAPIDDTDPTSPEPSTADPGGTDPTGPTEPTPVGIVVEMPDGSTIDVGSPTIDTDNDNIPDAAPPTTTPWSSTPTTTARPTASSSPTSRARSRPTPCAIRRRASGRGRPRLTRARPRRRPTRATTPSPQRTTSRRMVRRVPTRITGPRRRSPRTRRTGSSRTRPTRALPRR